MSGAQWRKPSTSSPTGTLSRGGGPSVFCDHDSHLIPCHWAALPPAITPTAGIIPSSRWRRSGLPRSDGAPPRILTTGRVQPLEGLQEAEPLGRFPCNGRVNRLNASAGDTCCALGLGDEGATSIESLAAAARSRSAQGTGRSPVQERSVLRHHLGQRRAAQRSPAAR